jgi:formate/nitrite transporter FocA (FNT family)
MNVISMFVLAVLAGSFIAFGAVLDDAGGGCRGISLLRHPARRPWFQLGLILVVIGGAELFTGNNLIVMAWAVDGDHPADAEERRSCTSAIWSAH